MNNALFFVLLLFLFPSFLYGQKNDTTNIPEAEIFYKPGSGGLIQKIPLDSQLIVANTLGDLLNNNTSVFINSNGVSGLQSISIRGTGSAHTVVYWNGLSIQSPTLGIVDLSTISSSTLDQIEIHSGASSLVDGSGGLGGSLQLSDQLRYDSLFHISLKTGFGSFGKSYRKLKFNWNKNKWSVLFNLDDVVAPNVFTFVNPATANLRIDTLKNAGLKSFSSKLGIGHRWNENLKLEALIWYNSSLRELPKPITANDFGDDFQEDQSWRSVLNFTWNNKKMVHQFSFGAIQDDLRYHADIESKIKTESIQGNYRRTYYVNNELKVKSALEFVRQTAISDGFSQDKIQDKLAYMINPQWKWKNKFTADLIFRMESYDNEVAPFMPAVLLHYKFKNGVNIRATASRIYRQPTFNELYWSPGGNPNLLPENGSSFELGIDYLAPNEKLECNISGFFSQIEDWIIWFPEDGVSTAQNLFLVKNQGIDFGLSYQKNIGKKLFLKSKINYSYVLSRNYNSANVEDNSLGKQLIFVPKHRLNANMNLFIKNRWIISYQYRFTDQRFIARDHSSWMPYYMLSDLAIQYSFTNMRWVDYISLNVNNLLNKNYEVVPYQPMMQRNVMVNLKFKFEK